MRVDGGRGPAEWDNLEEAMAPLGEAAVAIPFAGMRADAGVGVWRELNSRLTHLVRLKGAWCFQKVKEANKKLVSVSNVPFT